jgi:hypothetical protein
MANGLSGASFSDSRFSPEYYTLGNQRVGKLWMRHSTAPEEAGGPGWYLCTASVINRALLVTAAHCLCMQAKGVGDVCLPDVVNGTLQVGGAQIVLECNLVCRCRGTNRIRCQWGRD